MLRSVILVGGKATWLTVGCALLVGCTAANPAYRASELDRPDGGDGTEPPPVVLRDAGAPRDTARPADLTPPPPDAASTDGPGVAVQSCSGSSPPIAGITGVDSIAIDSTGVIYFNQDDTVTSWIDRILPDGKRESRWATIPAGLPTRGIAIDNGRRTLYVLAAFTRLQAIDMDSASRVPRDVYSTFGDANDIVVGPDGKAYVTDQGDNQVYSVTSTGSRLKVTGAQVGDMARQIAIAGLTFDRDRALLVGTNVNSTLTKIVLKADGTEGSRSAWGKVGDWANGLVVDASGRVFVAVWSQDPAMPRSVVRLEGDGMTPTPVLTGGRFSAMAFGRGRLNCQELYIAEPFGELRRIPTDSPGLAAP